MFTAILFASLLFFQSLGNANLSKNGIALSGYDAVAYFKSEPIEGSTEYQSKFEGATYLFSSSANKETFDSSPKKYVPAYGGWCAYAMGLGPDKVKINPNRYKILEGKLYLFYDFKGTDTFVLWENDEEALKQSADKNWKKIQH